jgi:hypothetical protein
LVLDLLQHRLHLHHGMLRLLLLALSRGSASLYRLCPVVVQHDLPTLQLLPLLLRLWQRMGMQVLRLAAPAFAAVR